MVLFNLKRHIKNTSIIFNEKASEESCGIPCGLSFGLPHDEDNNCLHPLQKERLFFHFPWQELFLNIDIPDISQSWTDFTILLDLDAGWPRNLVLNRDVFQLFSIPAINLRQAAAQPLICDGTRQQYTIRHPEMEYGFEVHSVKGVFEITKEGMSFIKPGIISGTSPSYETEEQKNSKGQKRHCLLLHFPAAFENPKTIVTEAIWFQPWFSEKIPEKLTAVPFSTVTPGIRWDLLAGPVPHAENLFQDSQDGLLHFLAINNRDTLDRDGLIDILQVMGIMEQKYFRHLCDLLTDIRIEKSPMYETQFSGILKHRYILKFREYDQGVEPLMDVFIRQIEKILGVWISGARIEVHKEIADSRSGLSREKDVK
jgi:type VI secretion system protein ImpG